MIDYALPHIKGGTVLMFLKVNDTLKNDFLSLGQPKDWLSGAKFRKLWICKRRFFNSVVLILMLITQKKKKKKQNFFFFFFK